MRRSVTLLRKFEQNLPDLAYENWPVMFGRSLVKDGTFGRYVTGSLSRDEANRRVWSFINDPPSIYELWFEQCNWDCPIMERRDNIAGNFVKMLGVFRGMMAGTKDLRARIAAELDATGDEALSPDERSQLLQLRRDLKIFREEISSAQQLCEDVPIWRQKFGNESALVAAEVFFAFERDGRPIKESDGIDFVHVMYLPHADLWRGDRAFSDLLKKHKVSFSDRVVPTLLELPARIEAEVERQPSN